MIQGTNAVEKYRKIGTWRQKENSQKEEKKIHRTPIRKFEMYRLDNRVKKILPEIEF